MNFGQSNNSAKTMKAAVAKIANSLNLKDNIDFGTMLYQEERSSSLLLINEEQIAIELCFKCTSVGFSVYPQQCRLAPGSTQEVRFSCRGLRIGQLAGEVTLLINSAEAKLITLEADITQLNLELYPDERIGFRDTLVTQSETAALTVKNRGSMPTTVKLKLLPAPSLEHGDPDFEHPAFSFLVKQSRLYPEASAEFQCVFTPQRSGLYSTTVYLDAEGRFNRLPMQLEAKATPPDVMLQVEQLDFERVTIGASSQISFEIKNYSSIQVEFQIRLDSLRPGDQDDLPLVQFSQTSGNIPARAAISLNCVITPRRLGRVTQGALFDILGRQEPLFLEIVSDTIPPQVKLKTNLDEVEVDIPDAEGQMCELGFGTVPYGFSQQKELHIFNLSPVQQEYWLKIEPDNSRGELAERLLIAQDFAVVPEKIRLQSAEHQTLSVSLLAKHAAAPDAYSGFVLSCYSKCSAIPLARCSLQASVINARFSLQPQVFRLQPCHVGVAHPIKVRIQNVSPVLGRWLFPPQELGDQCIISCSQQAGVLEAGAYQDLVCTLIPRGPGDVVAPVSFVSDVGNKEVLQCMVTYNARRPDVAVSVDQLRYSGARLLETQSKPFRVSNRGLSDARIKISAARPGSFFTVRKEFQEFVLRAGEAREITLDFTANVSGVHQDTLLVYQELTNTACEISEEVRQGASEIIKIKLQGEAKGTSLVCLDHDFAKGPDVDCGLYFTTEQLIKRLKVENHGQDPQTLTWSPVQSRTSSEAFLTQIENNKITLEPGQFCVFVFTAKSQKPTERRQESWMLRTNIQGRSTDTAFIVNLQYRFVQSQVEVTDDEGNKIADKDKAQPATGLEFSHSVFPVVGDPSLFAEESIHENGVFRLSTLSRKLTIKNTTPIATRIQVIVAAPFSVRLTGSDTTLRENLALGAQETADADADADAEQLFVSFLLSAQDSHQDVEVRLSEAFCDRDAISKEIQAALQIRLMPVDQSPQNPPTLRVPLKASIRYPAVEFRSCSEQAYQARWNEPPENYFAELSPAGEIDFGSTIPGTPINRYIFVKNISAYPIQLAWKTSRIEAACTFDISPNEVGGSEGISPGQIVMFTCKFLCEAGEKPSLQLKDISTVCSLLGGPSYEYRVSAQISNLAVDVTPSHVNFAEISFCSEQTQSFFIQNVSEVATVFQVRIPRECLPFVKRLNDEPLNINSETTWEFPLLGNQKKEIRMVFCPRVPGRFYVPVYIRIGHLEELLIPVTATAYVEQIKLLTEQGQNLPRHTEIMPWSTEASFPPYEAFLRAAFTYLKSVPQLIQTASSLQKEVQEDGSIVHNGKLYEVRPEVSDAGALNPLLASEEIVTLADELVQTQVELFKARNSEKASKVVSKAKTRQEQLRKYSYLNEAPFQTIRTVSDLLKTPVLAVYTLQFAPCSRMKTTQQTVRILNAGATPLSLNLERRFYYSYGITVEPEKISRLPNGESLTMTLSYTPSADQPLGQVKFLIPMQYRSGAIGLIQCSCNVTVPTIKPTNLMLLARNFSEFPVMKNGYEHTLHFGKCLFGRALRFSVVLSNPSALPATFSCDAQGGSTVPYQLDSKVEIDPIAKLQNKLDDLFTIQQTNGVIQPNSTTQIMVQFKPRDCFQAQYGQGCVFCGELKFNVKIDQEAVSKLSILLIGVGYHPLIKIDSSMAQVPAVFPREVSQQYAAIQIQNDSPDAVELFVPEFDPAHTVEQAALDALSMVQGTTIVKRTKAKTSQISTAYFSEFTAPGEVMSIGLQKALEEEGLGRLWSFVEESYQLFLQQPTVVQRFFEKRNAKDALSLTEGERASSRPRTAVSTLQSRVQEREQARLAEFEVPFNAMDFSYEPTEEEKNQLRYGRGSDTVQAGRSFRVHPQDTLFSSLPFLFYAIAGAPLSGKSALARLIQDQFHIHGKTIPVITLDQILGEEPETYRRFFRIQEEQNAAALQAWQKKGSKGPQPPQDQLAFMQTEEYIDALATEFCERLSNFFEVSSEQYLQIGLVLDGFGSRFVPRTSQLTPFLLKVFRTVAKHTRYEKQVATSRLAFYPVLTDLSPKTARQRQIQKLLQEQKDLQREAETTDSREEKEKLLKRAQQITLEMIDARQCYDAEDRGLAGENAEAKEALSFAHQRYSKVYASTDVLGKRQAEFLQDLPLIDKLIQELREGLLEMHRELIRQNLSAEDKAPEELAYEEAERQVKQAEEELQSAKKTNLKQVQQRYDELVLKLQECAAALPPSPVERIPVQNLFQFTELWLPEDDVLAQSLAEGEDTAAERFHRFFGDILGRYTQTLSKFAALQEKARLQAAGALKNQRISILEEVLVHQAFDVMPFAELKKAIEDTSSDLFKILEGKKDMRYIVTEAYKQLPDDKTQLYQPAIICSEFMEYYEACQHKKEELRKEIDALSALTAKTLTKQQSQDLVDKKKEIKELEEQMKAKFSPQLAQIEAANGRWIVPAHGKKTIYFRLLANKIQSQKLQLTLQARTSELKLPITLETRCDWPHIVSDWSAILPQNKGYSQQQGSLDFGTLRNAVVPPEIFSRPLQPHDLITSAMDYQALGKLMQEKGSSFLMHHVRTVLLENDSVFPARVVLALDSQLQGERPQTGLKRLLEDATDDLKKTEKKTAQKAEKGKQPSEQKPPCFAVYPPKLTLQPGEKFYAFITAFPETPGPQTAQLYVGVENNPDVMSLKLQCSSVVPSAKFSIPECPADLLPMSKLQGELLEMAGKLSAQPGDTNQQKKQPPKGKEAAKAPVQCQLNIPRISLRHQNIAELGLQNTGELPLEVLFEPCFKDEAIQQYQETFHLAETARSFKAADVVTKQTSARGAQVTSTMFCVKSRTLLIQNTRFTLKPGDSGAIKFEFSSKDCTQLAYPGRLIVRQAAAKPEPDACEIDALKPLKDLYRTPLINQPIVVAAEAHCVDASISVTFIEQSENRIPASTQAKSDAHNQTIQFGTCKAMTHFQAEVTLTNNGMYRVAYEIDIVKAFANQLKIIKMAAPEPQKPSTPSKAKGRSTTSQAQPQQSQQEVKQLISSLVGTLEPCPEPVMEEKKPDAPAKKEKKTSRANSRLATSPVQEKTKLGPNQTVIQFDFYAISTQDLQNQPAAQIVFSDPTTKQLLIKTSINISAKVKFSDISVSPDRSLVFGDFAHGKQPVKTMTIENNGLFTTNCAIEPLQQSIKRFIMTGQVSQFTQEYEQAYANLGIDKTKLAAGGFYIDVNDQAGRPQTPSKAKAPKKAPQQTESPQSLVIGPFTLSPCYFQLKPGQKQQVQIAFNAIGTADFKEYLSLDYSNRLQDRPQGSILTEAIIQRLDEQLVKEFQKVPEFLQVFKYRRDMLGDFANASTVRYTLSACSQIPGFSVEPQDLYEEQQIVNQAITDPVLVTEGAQYSIMANQLCFGSCQLNNAMKERIRFHNPFMVETNIAVFITTRQEPLEQLFAEFVGEGTAKVQQFIEQSTNKKKAAAPASKQIPIRSKSGDKKKQEQFKGENIILNDDDAWCIDRNYIQVLPQESQYVTVTYKPTQQVQSKARIIAISLDTWMRVAEQLKKSPPQKGEKGDPEKALHTQLTSYFTEENKKNVQMDLRLIAVGVLPEVVLGPKQVVLRDVLVNQITQLDVQQVYIKNMGRVPCKFSLQIRATSVEDSDYFSFTKESSTEEPENRLFTGLKEVKPGATMTFGVTPCLQGKVPQVTTTIEARIVANILTGEDQFNGLDIPLKLTLVKAPVCLVQRSQEDKAQEKFLLDVIQILFQLPDTPTSQSQAAIYLTQMPESSAFNQARQQLTQQLNLLQEKPEYKQRILLTDGTPVEAAHGTVISLVNQSQQVQRYEIDPDQCQRLCLQIQPTMGHINPGSSTDLVIKMIPPPEQQEPEKGKNPKKQVQTQQRRNLLFGNPLMIKITPISLKKTSMQQWDNSQERTVFVVDDAQHSQKRLEKVPEPEFDVPSNPQNLMQLQKEWDDFQLLLQNKKAKLTPTQQTRLSFLQHLVENRQSLEFQLTAASSYIEADLFGCFDNSKLKLNFKTPDGTFQALHVQQQGSSPIGLIELPFGELPILQRSIQEFFVMNEGLSAPAVMFQAENSTAFSLRAPERFFPRPDLYATAVKEQYPQICEIPAITQEKEKAKSKAPVDKNYITTMQAKYSSLETSPYAAKLVLTYEPRIPGSYEERFVSQTTQIELRCTAKATLPLCHIECPESSYLETQRPASALTPQIFSNLLAQNIKSIKCLTIQACGVGGKASASVYLLNTVSQAYDIELKRLPESTDKISTSLQTYQVASGERLQIKFTYDSDARSLKKTAEEAFYLLKIPQFDIQIPILVAGLPRDPDVSVNTNKLNFGSVGYGEQRQMEISLINREATGFNYRVKPVAGLFDVKVTPTQGIIPANGSTSVIMTCTPLTEAKVSQVVQIEVAKKSIPLQVNVKYECFKSRHSLELLPESGQVDLAVPVASTYDLDLGNVFLADSRKRVFKLTNVGQTDVIFALDLRLDRLIQTARKDTMELKKCLQNLQLDVENAERKDNAYILQAHQAALISVSFVPKDIIVMDKQFGLALYIKTPGQGQQRINILGKSMRPGLHASATELDYGIVVADLAPEKCRVRTLRLTNQDRLPLNIEYISESTDFCVVTPPLVDPLKPGEHVDVQIRFQPVFAQQFTSALAVTVNGLYRLRYLLQGTSVYHNFTSDTKLLQVGQILIRSSPSYRLLAVRNNSAAAITVRVELDREQEIPQGLFYSLLQPDSQADVITRALEMLQGWETRTMKQRYLQEMQKTAVIPPGQFASIAAFYLPLKRQAPFRLQGNLIVEECQTLEKFFYIEGAGIGASVKLLSSQVDLPPCLVGSFVQSQFQLENTGDVPVTFNIEAPPRSLAKKAVIQMFETGIIQIKPLQATIQPGQLINIAVKFSPPPDMKPQRIEIPPTAISYELNGQRIQLGEFAMTCTAESTKEFNSTSQASFQFECAARGTDQQQARIDNATAAPFEVKTVLQGAGARHFRVPDRLVIPPGGLEFTIQYKPMAQTLTTPHEAQLIIASPEGGANTYTLQGKASAPQLDGFVANTSVQKPPSASVASAKKPLTPDKKKLKQKGPVEVSVPTPVTDNVIQVQERLPAYKQIKLSIPLQNWETTVQRFVISHEFFDNAQAALCRFAYPQFVDVAPNAPRVVEVAFTPFALQVFAGYLVFKNDASGEFLKFQFALECNTLEPLQKLVLETSVRDSVEKHVSVPNLFGKAGLFTPHCARPDVTFGEERAKLSAKAVSAPMKIIFKPLVPCQNADCVLEFDSVLVDEGAEIKLANIQFMLQLTANPPRPSSPVKIQADLGKTLKFQINLKNETKERLVFNTALTQLSDIQDLYKQLTALAQPAQQPPAKAKAEVGIVDGKKFHAALNCVSLAAPTDVPCEANKGFIVNLSFQPKQIGDFHTNIVIFNKVGGIWVIPILGKCTRPPALGSITLE